MHLVTRTAATTIADRRPTADVAPPVVNQSNSEPIPQAAHASCRARWALRSFRGLCWLTALAVVAFVTPGEDWLRRSDGSKICGFRVGGGEEEIFDGCDPGLPRSNWCSYFTAFSIVQTAASIHISVAALLLLAATCDRKRRRWGIFSAIFFMIYAIHQAVAVGLVVGVGAKLTSLGSQGDGTDSTGSWTGEWLGPSSASRSSSFSSTSSRMSVETEYGNTLISAICACAIGFNESLVLLALSRGTSQQPGVAAAGGCFGLGWRRERRRGSGASNASSARTLSPSSSFDPAGHLTRSSSTGAASNMIGSRKPLAAQTHPRPFSAVDQA